ncbi:hypothetical protein [Methylomonas rapida]|jgi:hypothetical protein|uniref:DUF5348 domain-containing protein n=1 Tax=Methylomonas rapida TaxID=2963939 RepID=A0ABY7GCK5_9GAMM|nr:hypothetical protein [Methylomonas rapida]WAR43014.1 hypothetical protein NM686_011430 [Methylomonas rapida]
MNYPNGQKMKVGDKLRLWEGCVGEVVCSIDDEEYSDKFTKKDWEYLGEGVLINTDIAGLIHYTEPESSFQLMQRKRP